MVVIDVAVNIPATKDEVRYGNGLRQSVPSLGGDEINSRVQAL